MSDTCRSPPNRITLHREVITIDIIVKTAKNQRCYLLKVGITEFSSLLRVKNAKRLCNSRIRGAGEVFHLLLSAKTSHRPIARFRSDHSTIAEYAPLGGQSLPCASKSASWILMFTTAPLSLFRGLMWRCSVMTRLCEIALALCSAKKWRCRVKGA